MILDVYAVKHKDKNVIAASRSGGIFTALSDYVLNNNGIIYGCILSEDFDAIHIRATNQLERDKMRGSKYIQSKLGETFKNVKDDLTKEKLVLFSGTPCQIAGLKSFLNNDYENLICVDIVCHGVPSSKVWHQYLDWLEKKYKSNIKNVDFRNKADFGWRDQIETITLKNNKNINSSIYKNLFCNRTILRPSCYTCRFKSLERPSDITIGDYWGIENAAPEYDDNKGTSLALINSIKGKKIFEKIKDDLIYKETRIEDSMQPALIAPFSKPDNRDEVWNSFENDSFKEFIKKYANYNLKNQIKDHLRYYKRKLQKNK